jgi:hypothetical protein
MSAKLKKIRGGQGGKRGHSNMTHWTGTEEIKNRARVQQRAEAKRQVREALLR